MKYAYGVTSALLLGGAALSLVSGIPLGAQVAQTFVENATGASLTVVVNHLKSKGSACDAIGDPDTGDGQGN